MGLFFHWWGFMLQAAAIIHFIRRRPEIYWLFIILIGGWLGVLFMIPLRRQLIVKEHGNLTFPEGTACADVLVAGALDGVFVSRDGARNWKRATPPGDDELRNFDSLAIDPANPEIIYAGTFHLPWKTIDGGQNWSAIHAGMIEDSDVLSLAFDANRW